jgi:FKBP-type peptidyl-prolyl cis-trans isomerase SlyD
MTISKNKVVTIDYTLTNPAGEVLDTSKGQGPLPYLHGSGGIIPGLESALEGKKVGDSLQVTVEPDQAYGQRDPAMVQPVARKMFPANANVSVGTKFQAQTQHGPRVVTVVGVNGDEVTIDANHPLAGVTLKFDVRVVGIRDATAEELSHGHVHGPGGHHH